mmetsp:Transcript_4921/g.8002  ORF Transcript_4921/g.8002 Transcript_4921/m.8002 type:complete len:213 (-) Transcript_4921:1246-1884(-)
MRVDRVELHLLLSNLAAKLCRKIVLEILQLRPRAIHNKSAILLDLVEHRELRKERSVVASHIVCSRRCLDFILTPNRMLAKSQVGNCCRPSLLRRVAEVTLRIEFGPFADDLSRCFICAYSTIRSQAEEKRLRRTFWNGIDGWSNFQAGMRHIIIDTNAIVIFRYRLLQIVEHCLAMARGELLTAKAIVPTNDSLIHSRFAQCCENICMQWQ